jgi:hypothetical protein
MPAELRHPESLFFPSLGEISKTMSHIIFSGGICMRYEKQRAVFAALVLAVLMIGTAACGGSSSTSNESSGGASSESSESTAKPSSGGGGDSSKCAELFSKTDQLSSQMDAFDTGAGDDMSVDFNGMAKVLESFTPDVPSAIRDDWKTIVSGFKEYASALNGVNFSNLADPRTMEKLTKAAEAMENPKFLAAYENIEQWTKENCPSYATE